MLEGRELIQRGNPGLKNGPLYHSSHFPIKHRGFQKEKVVSLLKTKT